MSGHRHVSDLIRSSPCIALRDQGTGKLRCNQAGAWRLDRCPLVNVWLTGTYVMLQNDDFQILQTYSARAQLQFARRSCMCILHTGSTLKCKRDACEMVRMSDAPCVNGSGIAGLCDRHGGPGTGFANILQDVCPSREWRRSHRHLHILQATLSILFV